MTAAINLIGQRFGRLTVEHFIGYTSSGKANVKLCDTNWDVDKVFTAFWGIVK